MLIDKTRLEDEAILAARASLATALNDIGRLHTLDGITGEQAAYIVEMVVEGFTEYIRKSDEREPIPFVGEKK